MRSMQRRNKENQLQGFSNLNEGVGARNETEELVTAVEGAGTAAADHFIQNRVVEGTRVGYRGKLRTMSIYLMDHCLFQYVNDLRDIIPIKVPLPFQVVKDMFGWLGTNTDIPIRGRRNKILKEAKEKMEKSYREAISEETKEGDEDFDEDADEYEVDEAGNIRVPDGPLDLFAAGGQTVTVKTMSGYKSALKWVYEEVKVPVPADIKEGDEDFDQDADEYEVDEAGNIRVPDGPLDLFAAGGQTVTVKTMSGYKSALKWVYEEVKVPFPADMDQMLEDIIAGYTRKVAEKKLQGVMPISEGKQPVSYSGFSYLCKVLMSLIPKGMLRPWKISIFGWSFETMSWNILGRCSNVHSLMLEHIDWAEDCLMVCIPSHKGDKSGTSISQVSGVCGNAKFAKEELLHSVLYCP